jgi:hypothetical protein
MTTTERREYDAKHLAHVRTLPCCVCGGIDVEAHHPRNVADDPAHRYVGLATKASDRWAVPLCSRCHRALHAFGNEREWWSSLGLDPLAIALKIRRPQ